LTEDRLARNPNITDGDVATVRDVRRLLLAVLAIPTGPLEHAVQLAHESTGLQKHDPDEVFDDQGVPRQALRMFWHFRCNLEAVMPQEAE
jgi:hypothetical protein